MTKQEMNLVKILQNRIKETYEFAQVIDTSTPSGERLKMKYTAIYCELWSICKEAGIDVNY